MDEAPDRARAWHTDSVAISIDELERAAALGWRAPEEERLGDWLLRAAGGFTGRANSALAVGEAGPRLTDAIETVCQWYAERGLPPMIAVPYPAGNPEASQLDRVLAERGWTVRPGAATVMTTAADINRGATRDAVEIRAEPDAAWLARYHYRGRQLPAIAVTLLLSSPWQAFASVRAAGQAIAIGRVAVASQWAGITAVEVDPVHRRRGLAAAVTTVLAAEAARQGAAALYLQVEDDNAAARALYRRMGFADHHGYHYRVAPGAQTIESLP